MGGGIVLTSLGVLGMGAGTGIYAEASSGCSTRFDQGSVREICSDSAGKLVGMTVLLTSAVVTAIGVPLWIYGAEKIAVSPSEQPIREVSVRVGPTSAALHLSF